MSNKAEKKIERCKYADYRWDKEAKKEIDVCEKDRHYVKDITEDDCENCPNFKSKYIEFPITVNETDHDKIEYNKDSWHCKMGALVKVRPCGEEYGNKTYLGFYIGDLPLMTTGSFNSEKGIYKVGLFSNPAIFVPELRKIIFGIGSWWGEIESPDEIKDITDDDISNCWYVKLAKMMSEEK